MSAETKAALEAALEAHIVDELNDGRTCTSYVVVAETSSLEQLDRNSASFFSVHRYSQSVFTTIGLLQSAVNFFAIDWNDIHDDE